MYSEIVETEDTYTQVTTCVSVDSLTNDRIYQIAELLLHSLPVIYGSFNTFIDSS